MCGTIWDWYAEEKLSSEQKKSLSNAVTEKLQGPNSKYWKSYKKYRFESFKLNSLEFSQHPDI